MNQGDQRAVILPPQPRDCAAPLTPLERAWSRDHLRLHRHLRRQPALLPPGTTLLLAVSGGQDSMALLALLLGLRRLYGWRLLLWHGDHGWRPESGRQADELGRWCLEQRLQLHSDRLTAAAPPGEHGVSSTSGAESNPEALARRWRYQCLEHCALSQACNRVVSGHTASDRAETLLLHLARGSHRRGLGSLRSLRPLNGGSGHGIQLSRPLLIFSRQDTERICRNLKLPVWHDSSNDDQRFSRNRIRAEVLPVLEQLHPGATRRLSGTAERLHQEQEQANEWVQVALHWLSTGVEDPLLQLDRDRLTGLQPVNQAAVLEQWLQGQGISPVGADQITQVLSRLQRGQPPGRVDLAGGWQLQWNRSRLELSAANSPGP